MTEDQQYCIDTLADVFGGHHHLPKVHEFGPGVCINYSGDLSTFDYSRLTNLVLAAHSRCVRIEILSGGPRSVKIAAHRRKPDGTRMYDRHPSLNDLRAQIDALIAGGAS